MGYGYFARRLHCGSVLSGSGDWVGKAVTTHRLRVPHNDRNCCGRWVHGCCVAPGLIRKITRRTRTGPSVRVVATSDREERHHAVHDRSTSTRPTCRWRCRPDAACRQRHRNRRTIHANGSGRGTRGTRACKQAEAFRNGGATRSTCAITCRSRCHASATCNSVSVVRWVTVHWPLIRATVRSAWKVCPNRRLVRCRYEHGQYRGTGLVRNPLLQAFHRRQTSHAHHTIRNSP